MTSRLFRGLLAAHPIRRSILALWLALIDTEMGMKPVLRWASLLLLSFVLVACGTGPVMQINGRQYVESLTTDRIDEILASLN